MHDLDLLTAFLPSPFAGALGHMVPMDQPAVALAMIKTLVYGTGGAKTGFLSSEQNLARASASKDARMCQLDKCPNCAPPEPVGEDTIFQTNTASQIQLSLGNLGILVAVFASGIIITCICQRHRQRESQKRVLASLDDDMELTDQDSIYRDTVDAVDGEYT